MAIKQELRESGGLDQVSSFTPTCFRKVLSRWPTGVSVVSTITPDGAPLGAVIGSFSSISLEPPLVAFSVMKSSSSLAAIRETKKFCVNVLSSKQADLVDVFCKGDPKTRFDGVNYSLSPGGLPILNESLAWIDTTVEHEYEGGDHIIVLGRVQALSEGESGTPLVFAQGTLGVFDVK